MKQVVGRCSTCNRPAFKLYEIAQTCGKTKQGVRCDGRVEIRGSRADRAGAAVAEGVRVKLAPSAERRARRVLERAARRILDEQLNADAPIAPTGGHSDHLDRGADQVAFLGERESAPVLAAEGDSSARAA